MILSLKRLIQNQHKSSTVADWRTERSAQSQGSHQFMMAALTEGGEGGI